MIDNFPYPMASVYVSWDALFNQICSNNYYEVKTNGLCEIIQTVK